jgi:hypothetical protein
MAVAPPASITTSQRSTSRADAVPMDSIFSFCVMMVSPGTKGARQSPETMVPMLVMATRIAKDLGEIDVILCRTGGAHKN